MSPDDANAKPSAAKRRWWPDLNIWVGIAGVVATVVVGAVTYWLTASSEDREYRERLRAARADILTAVSRSIGEGVVPDREKISSVIRSSRRQYGLKEQDAETVESVLDDIVSRVLSNEFLDAKRREELSTKLLSVRATAAPQAAHEDRPPRRPPADEFALLFSVTAGMMAASVLVMMSMRFRELIRRSRERGDEVDHALFRRQRELRRLMRLTVLTFVLLAVVVSFVYLVARFSGRMDELFLSETLGVKTTPAQR